LHPLEPPGQQRQLILSKHVKLLIYKDIKEDKEYILENGLALVFAPEPLTRARL
jgi:hypothetical protein